MSYWQFLVGHIGLWFTVLVVFTLTMSTINRKNVKIDIFTYVLFACIFGFFSSVGHWFVTSLK